MNRFTEMIKHEFFNEITQASLSLWLPDGWDFIKFDELNRLLRLRYTTPQSYGMEWERYYSNILHVICLESKSEWLDNITYYEHLSNITKCTIELKDKTTQEVNKNHYFKCCNTGKRLKEADEASNDYVLALEDLKTVPYYTLFGAVFSEKTIERGESAIHKKAQKLFKESPELRLLAPLGLIKDSYCYFRGESEF